MRVNISLREDLLKKLDEKAKALHICRSAYIALALSRNFQLDEFDYNAISSQLNS